MNSKEHLFKLKMACQVFTLTIGATKRVKTYFTKYLIGILKTQL